MKKLWDKLLSKFKGNKLIYIFLIGMTLIAIVTGTIYASILSADDQNLVKLHLETFFQNVEEGKLNYIDSLKNGLVSNLLMVLGIWLLGISVIGIPVIIFLFFSKMFVIGFSVAAIITHYKLPGALLSLAYIFPHHILNIFIYSFLIIYSFTLSFKIMQAIIYKKTIDFKPIVNRYLKVLGIVSLFIIGTSLIETFLTPILVKLILPLV